MTVVVSGLEFQLVALLFIGLPRILSVYRLKNKVCFPIRLYVAETLIGFLILRGGCDDPLRLLCLVALLVLVFSLSRKYPDRSRSSG